MGAIISIVIILGAVLGIYIWTQGITNPFSGNVDAGIACKIGTQCKNFGTKPGQMTCCPPDPNGTNGNPNSLTEGRSCQYLYMDYNNDKNTGWCPAECRGDALSGAGTCFAASQTKDGATDPGNLKTIPIGGKCAGDANCVGFTVVGPAGKVGCCDDGTGIKKCANKLKDYLGFYYCPKECKGSASGEKGTCSSVADNSVNVGGQCARGEQCKGYTTDLLKGVNCCDGVCTTKLKDWAGVYYCPKECKGSASGKKGTCSTVADNSVNVGGQCSRGEQCKGYTLLGKGVNCCDGVCTNKLKDYMGSYYCPKECKGSAGGNDKKGTCSTVQDNSVNVGGQCSRGEQCKGYKSIGKGVNCCGGVCTNKIPDYVGAYYCPKDCKACSACKAGSCGNGDFVLNRWCEYGPQCAGFTTGWSRGRTCCDNHCEDKVKDIKGSYVCKKGCIGSCKETYQARSIF